MKTTKKLLIVLLLIALTLGMVGCSGPAKPLYQLLPKYTEEMVASMTPEEYEKAYRTEFRLSIIYKYDRMEEMLNTEYKRSIKNMKWNSEEDNKIMTKVGMKVMNEMWENYPRQDMIDLFYKYKRSIKGGGYSIEWNQEETYKVQDERGYKYYIDSRQAN